MQLIRSTIIFISGAILGMAILYFFSDALREEVQATAPSPPTPASPPPAPATICDCPAAEPPLAGRFVVASQVININAGGANRFSVACPAGAQLISGSCVADYPTNIFNVSLRESGFYTSTPTDWNCSFRNNEAMALNFRASVVCLKPTP